MGRERWESGSGLCWQQLQIDCGRVSDVVPGINSSMYSLGGESNNTCFLVSEFKESVLGAL